MKFKSNLFSVFFCLFLLSACENDFSSPESQIVPKKEEKTAMGEGEGGDGEEIPHNFPGFTEDDFESVDEEEEFFEIEDHTVYEVPGEENLDDDPCVHERREWTFLVYMAADNNLESDGIADFNEMEQADLDESINLLVLFDRAQNYDATNGNWTDTRLYEVRWDEAKNKTLIASERLDCEELGLSKDSPAELDMGNPVTLSSFLAFARRCYPADNYGLIVWGHGTGWRSSENCLTGEFFSGRAAAIDSDSASYMTIPQIRSAIKTGMGSDKLALIGFDTCFAVCIESAYEMAGLADYMLGTPALVPESGWNYTEVFNSFLSAGSAKNAPAFMEAVCSQFQKAYENYTYASFTCLNLEKIPDVVKSFSLFSQSLADSLAEKSDRDQVFSVFNEKCVSYCAVTYPTDYYVDLKDMISYFEESDEKTELEKALDEAILYSWSAAEKTCSMGLFFCVYQGNGVIQGSHPSMYTNGSRDTLLSRFVKDCTGYVPSMSKSGSLLDKLFYTAY